jgi:tol-pal system protein YbgF
MRPLRQLRSLLAAALLGLALPQAHAGLFDDDEARARIEKLRTDVNELMADTGKRADALSRNQLDFTNQIDAVKADIAKLRGQLEVLTYELDSAQKRQKDFYVDLDNRLRKIEQAALQAAEQQKAAAAAPPAVDPVAETRDYEAALTSFKAGKYKDAVGNFQNFITAYPKSTLLPSAHYWAAASLKQLRDFKGAAVLFAQFAELWPNDLKAPDALLAEADCLDEGGDKKGARKVLEELVAQYPGTNAAQTAKPRLKKK